MVSKDALNDARLAALDKSKAEAKPESNFTYGANSAPTYQAPNAAPTARIYDNHGNLVNVYTEGPNAGRGVDNGELVIQGEKPVPNDTSGMTNTFTNNGEGVVGYVPPTSTPKKDPVYDALLASLSIYKIQGLAKTLEQIRIDYPDISSEDMLTLLRKDTRYNKEYLTRFSGNQLLNAAGKPMLDEKTYLKNEIAYDATFKAYGMQNYFSNTAQYADFIANEKSPTEIGNIVSAGFDRVINADTDTLDTYKRFFSSLTTQDIVAGLIGGKETMDTVNRKITSAEIGGAAVRQGLNAFQAATDIKNIRYSNLIDGTIGTDVIQASGATKETTKKAYEKIAGELPRAEFLSSISAKQAEQYGQKEAEKADILGLASEKRKLEILKDLERNRYKASTGAAANAFTSAKQMY